MIFMETLIEPKRVTVITGHFGSGKTEFAINYAIKLKNMGKKVTIVDFDIVNILGRRMRRILLIL